jgi:thiamine biosynthesis lipoprotein
VPPLIETESQLQQEVGRDAVRYGHSGGLTAGFVPAVVTVAAIAASCAVSTANAAAAPGSPVERARFLMGTRLVIEAAGPRAEAAIARAFAEVERLDAVLSNWRSDSEVARLNAAASEGPVRCSADLFSAASAALGWADRTGGAFDPTVESAVRRLGVRGDAGRLPGVPPETVAAGMPAAGPIGWRLVEADAGTGTIRFRARGLGLDFGGIGKGIALDAAAAALRRDGIASAHLDFGGQSLVFGAGPDDGGWLLGLSDPDDRDRAVGEVLLRSGSLSASGNGARDPGAAPHLLDPATGRPAPFEGSVTVIAPDATSADALSTALFVMGPDRGLRYATEHGLDVLYLRRDGDGSLRRIGRGTFLPGAPASSMPVAPAPARSGGRP